MDRKKRRAVRWVLLLIAFIGSIGGGFLWGFLAGHSELPPYRRVMGLYYRAAESPAVQRLARPIVRRPGGAANWHRAVPAGADRGAAERRRERDRLTALGYLGGYEEAPAERGITVHDPDRAWPGINLYSSGHAPEAYLMDMDGRVIHRWSKAWSEAFPQLERPADDPGIQSWRRVELLPDGDLLAIFEGHGLVRLDRDSRLRWAHANRSHHDLFVGAEGEIYLLTRREGREPALHEWKPLVTDYITVLSPEGVEIGSYSIADAFRDSHYAPALELVDLRSGRDVFHTNTLEILDGRQRQRLAAFAAGNALVSVPRLNLIAVIDLGRNRVVWALANAFSFQHDPTVLANGNLLLFDNAGHFGYSKVVELDPLTQEIVWGYFGNAENGFYSSCCGAASRLPNGNTLITETTRGRSFELTPEKSLVWEYVSPHRAGRDGELIASLWEMQRLPGDAALGWSGERRD